VTVALAVAALGLGLLMAAAGTGLGNATLADQYIDATRRAQSHLAEIGRLAPLQPGLQLGTDGGGYSWQVRISEPVLPPSPPAPASTNPAALYKVEVILSWRSGIGTRSVSLQSQRLARISDGDR